MESVYMKINLALFLLSALSLQAYGQENSQAIDDDNISQLASLTPLINIRNWMISFTCVRVDRFNPDHLLICTRHALYRYNIGEEAPQLIAGKELIWSSYREGTGSRAEFSLITDVVQLNQTAFIVSDAYNRCLRLIVNTTTSPFAGNCSTGNSDSEDADSALDGNGLEARFSFPVGLLLVNDAIYVADEFGIRIVDLTTRLVSTLHFNDEFPILTGFLYLTCGDPDCDRIYFTFLHGLASLNRAEPRTATVLGGSSYERGNRPASLSQLRNVSFPRDLIFLKDAEILVADCGNNKILQFDLASNTTSSLYVDTKIPRSMICYNGTLYIVTDAMLYSTSIIDDAISAECFGKVPDHLQDNQGG